jgi:hypothetical protein
MQWFAVSRPTMAYRLTANRPIANCDGNQSANRNPACFVDLFSVRSSNAQMVRISVNTMKATYWIALAVFTLALNSEYQNGKFPTLHRVAGRAGTTLCQIATRAEQTLAAAGLLTGRAAFAEDDLLALNTSEMAENQAEMLREQAEENAETLREQTRDKAEMVRDQIRAQVGIVRAQARIRRAQIEQMHFHARPPINFSDALNRRMVVVARPGCSKDVRVAISSGPGTSDDGEDSF